MIISTAPMKTLWDWRIRTEFRRCVRLVAIIALAVGGVLGVGGTARAETVAIVELQPQHTRGKCLDVAHMSIAHGAPVIQGDCWDGANQRWWFRSVGLNIWEIHPLHSNMCLDVAHMSLAHGAPVIQATCSGGRNQHWIQVGGNGFFSFKAEHSNMCLDVAHMSGAHGAPIVQATCSNGLNQLWLKLQVGTMEV
jgi:hypothetical protein